MTPEKMRKRLQALPNLATFKNETTVPNAADFFYFDPDRVTNFPVLYFRWNKPEEKKPDPNAEKDNKKMSPLAEMLFSLHEAYPSRRIDLALLNVDDSGAGNTLRLLDGAIAEIIKSKGTSSQDWKTHNFLKISPQEATGVKPDTMDFLVVESEFPTLNHPLYGKLAGLGQAVLKGVEGAGAAVDIEKYKAKQAQLQKTKAELEAGFKARIEELKRSAESLAHEVETILEGLQAKPHGLQLLKEARNQMGDLVKDAGSPLRKLAALETEAGKINTEVNAKINEGISLVVGDANESVQPIRDRGEAAYTGIRNLRLQVALELGESVSLAQGPKFNIDEALKEIDFVLGKNPLGMSLRLHKNDGRGYLLYVKYKNADEAAGLAKVVAILMAQTPYKMTIGIISPDAGVVTRVKEALGPFKFGSQKESYPSGALQKDGALILAIFPKADDTLPPSTRFVSRLGRDMEKRDWEGL